LLLMDYGASSPESLSLFYRYHADEEFLEVKRYNALDRSGEWSPYLVWDEVKELYEVRPALSSALTLLPSLTSVAMARGATASHRRGNNPDRNSPQP
jgi:hypothetical protein